MDLFLINIPSHNYHNTIGVLKSIHFVRKNIDTNFFE